MLNRLRTNWRAWPFFGMVSTTAALAAIYLLLSWNYKYVNETKTFGDVKVITRHGVDAWGPDAFIIVGISVALAVFVLVMYLFARNLIEVWQVVLFGIVDFIAGAVFGALLWDRISNAEFNAIEAWLGAACVAICVAAILANHLFYHDRH